MGGRAVEGTGLENRQGATPRGFESHPIRQRALFSDATACQCRRWSGMSKAMSVSRSRLRNLGWRRAWWVAISIWLLICIMLTSYIFPTAARLRAAWTTASYQTLIRDRQTIDAADAECKKLTSASNYSASLICIDNVLHMRYAYQDRLNGLTSYGEKQADVERLPDQFFAMAEGIMLWAVPSFGLYLLGVVVGRLKTRAEKPLHRPTTTCVEGEMFRWPDRTRRKPSSG